MNYENYVVELEKNLNYWNMNFMKKYIVDKLKCNIVIYNEWNQFNNEYVISNEGNPTIVLNLTINDENEYSYELLSKNEILLFNLNEIKSE